ncbi:energy-coupling factor ABC transporter ATP-binding protein [Thermodesulfobacteriota bacterium]
MDKNHLLINLEAVSFAYPGGRSVLKDLHFKLHLKEKVGLIGPNGSGKTTLFHVIMGLIKPTSGRIELFGREMKEEKDFRFARQRIGLLFQDADDQLFSPTVLEDVAFGPLNLGKPVSEARDIAAETLNALGLEGFEDRVTYKLSGGEKKLVSLATVLAMKPEVLLLDEPTTGLDLETTTMIINVLKKIDLSYIFISHNMDFISQTTDQIHGMSHGRILLEERKVPHTHDHSHGYGHLPHTHAEEEHG